MQRLRVICLAIAMLVTICSCPASGDEASGQEDVLAVEAATVDTVAGKVDTEGFRPPDWLLAAPTRHALFPPNGDVVTLGQLGSFARANASEDPLEEAEYGRWYIYSSEGELLNSLPDGIHWWEHYDTEWTERTRAYYDQEIYSSEYAGFTIYYRGEFEIVEVYDYDGTLMPSDFDPFTTDRDRMHDLAGDQLVVIARQAGEAAELP